MIAFLLIPLIYISIASAGSAALPPVDYKAISQEQSAHRNQEFKSEIQIQKPTQEPEVRNESHPG
jgi:hypothetical protein